MTEPPDGDQPHPRPPEQQYATGHRAPTAGGRRALMVAVVVVVAALVLSGISVGAWLLLRDSDRDGAAAPTEAVDAFLRAVYRDQDAAEAGALVCSEARDIEALQEKIDSIRAFEQDYPNPSYAWDDPQVVDETDQLAVVSVTVTMITADERTADQELRVSVLDKAPHGWWVCDVQSAPADNDADGEENGDEEQSGADEDADVGEDDGDDE